jgi:hypothetical protein
MIMREFQRWLRVLLVAALASACAVQRPPAERALAAAEAAYANISSEAASVSPDSAAAVESALADARSMFANADFADVSQFAPGLMERIAALAQSLPGLREKLDADWKVLAETVPGAIAALDRKLEDFGQPPAGMPGRAQFDKAKLELGELRAAWANAEALAGTSLAKAVALADQVRYDAVRALTEFQQQGS